MRDIDEDLQLIGHDIPWDTVDTKALFNVITFIPYAQVVNGKVQARDKVFPYANLEVRAKELPTKAILPITHKMDFMNLWQIYEVRGVSDKEEVNVIWSSKGYKGKIVSRFKKYMPRLTVWLSHKGAYYLINNPDSHPELKGSARYKAEAPIIESKPNVME